MLSYKNTIIVKNSLSCTNALQLNKENNQNLTKQKYYLGIYKNKKIIITIFYLNNKNQPIVRCLYISNNISNIIEMQNVDDYSEYFEEFYSNLENADLFDTNLSTEDNLFTKSYPKNIILFAEDYFNRAGFDDYRNVIKTVPKDELEITCSNWTEIASIFDCTLDDLAISHDEIAFNMSRETFVHDLSLLNRMKNFKGIVIPLTKNHTQIKINNFSYVLYKNENSLHVFVKKNDIDKLLDLYDSIFLKG